MKKSYLILHTAVLLAGFTGIFGKLIALNELTLVWYRVLFASIILFLILKSYKLKGLQSFAEIAKISKAGILITIHWIFFYASIKYSNISIGVVCYCLTSFFTAIFEPIINKKKFNLVQGFLSLFTLLGISLIFHFDSSYQLGITLGVISSAFAALYTIYNERLVQFYDSKLINFYQMLGGTIVLGLTLPVYFYYFPEESFIPSLKDTFYLFVLASCCTVALYVMFAESLKKIPAFTVNLTFNLEPIYAIILAFLFFDEGKSINFSFYIGISLIMTSILLQSLISIKKRNVIEDPIS
ncbi:drug/metabolite transporter (DMT)-like permease [Flavobacterium nitrogenifigens]|uniref:Drug/metabolite transporter (DMT)-like permease n=2 Tax=Flavobacterium TaxID=237 RepID=A0A7W7J098_9FLAO|nr:MULTISPECIES: DMT family transporter [Flavobacterium]MBB4803797.1 drug/metabolite transporter (DMT)-like permease [Flavobacterium nitrogenifigens]MBB6388398.1 drug/metabolite transporter (DMT)-like permease [Flavobacterium notoginsengisoli]